MNKWEMPMVKAVDDNDWIDGGSDTVDQIR